MIFRWNNFLLLLLLVFPIVALLSGKACKQFMSLLVLLVFMNKIEAAAIWFEKNFTYVSAFLAHASEDELDNDDDAVDVEPEGDSLDSAVTEEEEIGAVIGKSPDAESTILFIKPRPGLTGTSGTPGTIDHIDLTLSLYRYFLFWFLKRFLPLLT